jgi:hypothetical protein
MKDEKWYTQFGQFFWLPYFFVFLTLGGSLVRNRWAINVKLLQKFQKFNNLSKTVSFIEIFIGNPEKIAWSSKKSWKFSIRKITNPEQNTDELLSAENPQLKFRSPERSKNQGWPRVQKYDGYERHCVPAQP